MYYRRRRKKYQRSDLNLLGYDEKRVKDIILEGKKIKKIPICQKCGAQGWERKISSGPYGLYLKCTRCQTNVGIKVSYDITKDEQMEEINKRLEEYNKYIAIIKKDHEILSNIKKKEVEIEAKFYQDNDEKLHEEIVFQKRYIIELVGQRKKMVIEAGTPSFLSFLDSGTWIYDHSVASEIDKHASNVLVDSKDVPQYKKLQSKQSEHYSRISELERQIKKETFESMMRKAHEAGSNYLSKQEREEYIYYPEVLFNPDKLIKSRGKHSETMNFWKKIGFRNPHSPRELRKIEDEYYFPLVKEKEQRLKLFKRIFKSSDTNSWIYVLANNAMPGLYKVGWTERNPIDRAKDLSTTGLPEPFKVVYEHKTNLTMDIEKKIHKELDSYRNRGNREFFKTDLSILKKVIKETIAKEPEI